ncbi:MAG: hypothetical protein ACYSYM_14460, partial [Planctomycetota bacterium]
MHRLVVVSKDPRVLRLAQRYGREVFGADDLADALQIVQTVNPDMILCDHQTNPSYIRKFFKTADKNVADIPVVVVGSDDVDSGLSAELSQAGVHGYLRGSRDYDQMERIIDGIESKSGMAGWNSGEGQIQSGLGREE